jgi:pyruvate formate lyase activating enzyme
MTDRFYQEICQPAKVSQVLASIKKAQQLGIHVETRTNIIPTKNDTAEEHYKIACWIKQNLGENSPWHITRFFPAYKLSALPATSEASLLDAAQQAKRAGLKHVYVYNDKGCDCAGENKPVEFYLKSSAEQLHQLKQCAANCCSDEGILLKKYEQK